MTALAQQTVSEGTTQGHSAPVAQRRWPTFWLRSLTSRLVTGIVALVLVLVAVIGGTTYYFLQNYLDTKLDQQVASSAQQNASFVRQCILYQLSHGESSSPPCRGFPSAAQEYLNVVQVSGLPLNGGLKIENSGSANLSKLNLTKQQQQTFVNDPGTIRVLDQDGTELHAAAATVPVQGIGELTVITGLATNDTDSTLRRLVVLELWIGAAAVLIAVLATSWGVQRSLRNLYRVTGTAREVSAELSPEGAGLDRRVPVVEEGTEVGLLAESMNDMLAAVEVQFAARVDSENRMRQFLADASHELRTPLTSIRGFAELARMQRAAGTDAEDNLDRIESEGTRMSRLVEDLLILARTDSPDNAQVLHREPVQVQEMLDEVAAGSRAAFPERTIDLELTPAPLVLGDRDQLLRVVRNLVTNACTHTRREAPVTLRCFADGRWVAIQVVDGGPGLPPEEAAHVFERFWRADKARSRARGGTGLGMSIVATIVRAHGGSVRFDSTVESGSTVTVWLPADD